MEINKDIYKLWREGHSKEEIAQDIFDNELNYNNCDKQSGQYIKSYEEVLQTVNRFLDNQDLFVKMGIPLVDCSVFTVHCTEKQHKQIKLRYKIFAKLFPKLITIHVEKEADDN